MVSYFIFLGTASRKNVLFSYGRRFGRFGFLGSNVVEFYGVTKAEEKSITSVVLYPERGMTAVI
jgi:hypothetical protein